MIIQCRQCRTKFKFDDALMHGNGVWLRCSRCGHVYFQENPLIKHEADLPSEPAKPLEESVPVEKPVPTEKPIPAEKPIPVEKSVRAEKAIPAEKSVPMEKTIPVEKSTDFSKKSSSIGYWDANGYHPLDKVVESKQYLEEDINLSLEKEPEKSAGGEKEKVEKEEISVPKSSGKFWKTAVWSVFVFLTISAIFIFFIYPLVYPQFGDRIKNILVYVGISEPVQTEVAINQVVQLQNVQHRTINNYILGQIGVVEGTALNRADYPISRIMIKADILDAYSVVLGEHTVYAGNILTDEELTNLSEEEILLKLSQPEGMNNSNDKIMPNEQIPFMVVFSHEPSGVIKTTVVTVGAERLL